MVHRAKQPGAETSLGPIRTGKKVPADDPRKKLLREVLRRMRIVPFSPNVGIERIPIGPGEFLDGYKRLG